MTVAVKEAFDAGGPEITFSDDGQSLTESTQVRGGVLEVTYGALGLEESVRVIRDDGRQSLTEHVHNERGELAATLSRKGNGGARITYRDSEGRVVIEMSQHGVRTETRVYAYDEVGKRNEVARLMIDDDWDIGSQPSVFFPATEKK